MKNIYFLVLVLFITNVLNGQIGLPAGLTATEIELLQTYTTPNYNRAVYTTPPNSTIRTMAEWEEVQALTITWAGYNSLLREIVRHAKEEAAVIIICNDSINVKTYLANNNITMDNLSFIQNRYNSIWIRDYGQHTVYTNDVDSLLLVDWIYNRPRPDDDKIPLWVANKTAYDLYATTTFPSDLINTGGNFMPDGMGTAFSSRLVLTENAVNNPYNVSAKTEVEIDKIMNDFMGINRYIKMDTLPYDRISHIDMHMKLIDEETLLIGKYPDGVADGPQIENNIQYILNNYLSPFGTPYRIVRVNMPPDQFGRFPDNGGFYRTYTNSLFINNLILVPIYDPTFDNEALEIYRKNLPGYKIVGVNCNSIIPQGGALHCITKLIGVDKPLRIVHQPVRDTICNNLSQQINAIIQHQSGINEAAIHYRTDTSQPYLTARMEKVNNEEWMGLLPLPATPSNIFYYISATANSGKTLNRPLPAPEAYWSFYVDSCMQNSEIIIGEIYPNPAFDIINIPIVASQSYEYTFQIFDITGKLIKATNTKKVRTTVNKIDINHLESGTYILRVTVNNEVHAMKFVKD